MTIIRKLEPGNPNITYIQEAAEVLKKGGLVAFPTETVYGLGANALNSIAVENIFKVKGRPNDNPLIVHIGDPARVNELVREIPPIGKKLMAQFWPGPLTLIMKKSEIVPTIVTAGLDTVAIRMPSHPIALKLLKESNLPIAAPSANLSGKPSPTKEIDVTEDLEGKIDYIILGGSCDVGVESTVLDITCKPPVILRPGGVTKEQLTEIIGEVNVFKGTSARPASPGMKYRHYSPRAEVILVEGNFRNSDIIKLIKEYRDKDKKVGILHVFNKWSSELDFSEEFKNSDNAPNSGLKPMSNSGLKPMSNSGLKTTSNSGSKIEFLNLGDSDITIARNLFAQLREMDRRNVDIIIVEGISETGRGLAIMNRLRKAASKIIKF